MAFYAYEIFEQIIKTGSFAKAAENLSLTPSAVSHSVASLEAELGFSLFSRSRTGVNLTKEGMLMAPYIHGIVESEQAMKAIADEINGLTRGEIKIGTFNSVCMTWIPQIVQSFQAEYGHIKVQIFQGDFDDVRKWVKEGVVDIGIITLPTAENFVEIPVHEDELVCVAAAGWQKTDDKVINIKDLENEKWILPNKGYSKDIDNYLIQQNLSVSADCYIDDDRAIMALVEKGMGISLMTELAIGNAEYKIETHKLQPEYTRTIGVVMQKSAYVSPASKQMLNHILTYMKENGIYNIR